MCDVLSKVALFSGSLATLVRLPECLRATGRSLFLKLVQVSNSDEVIGGGSELKIQPTNRTPRCRVLRSSPTVFNQPKISSTRLRLR